MRSDIEGPTNVSDENSLKVSIVRLVGWGLLVVFVIGDCCW